MNARCLSWGWLAVLLLSSTLGCTVDGEKWGLEGQDVRLALLHTSDIHSRILRYSFTPSATDTSLGMDPDRSQEEGVGGVDRLAYLIGRERGLGERVMYLDSGDIFQGAPIFNVFQGEPEYRVLSELGVNATVIGNHEFDSGAANYAAQLERWATFPVLAANYQFKDFEAPWANALGRTTQPWTVVNVKGLRVGVVGMADTATLTSITEQGNSLKILPLEMITSAQQAVDAVRQVSDLVVVVSHLGLDADQILAGEVRGIDVILGGHLHIVLWPPKRVADPDGRSVIIAHSGAFLKYLGRLDLVLRKPAERELADQGYEVASFKYKLFNVDGSVDDEIARPDKLPHEQAAGELVARVREVLEPYQIEMAGVLQLQRSVGCVLEDRLPRYGGSGGDSPLGNLVAEAMQLHERVESDFALTNTTGIRDDIRGVKIADEASAARCVDPEGETAWSVSLEALFNVLPFENTITTMFLSGAEVQELFDYVAKHTAERGCSSQAQISGATVTLVCGGDEHHDYPHADDITIGGAPLLQAGTYELATNDYIANGGSGYEVLQRNTTQVNTFISMRDAVAEYLGRVGLVPCKSNDPALPSCSGGVSAAAVEDARIRVRY